ncbi:MAG: DUF445 domain-containing protein [Chitinophagales bacterium]
MMQYVLIPLISAFIGYLTNVIAIRMLFRPQQPVNILGYELQGLIPKRQIEMATQLGEIVERELLSVTDLTDRINTPEIQETIVQSILTSARDRLEEVVPRFIPQNIMKAVANSLETALRKEARNIIGKVLETGVTKLEQEISVKEIVRDRVLAFEIEQMEGLVKEVAAKELKHIEILGGVLGLIIGLLQVGILLIIP